MGSGGGELPPLLMMSEDEASFRYKTLVERCPRIVDGVLRDCAPALPEEAAERLRTLAADLRAGARSAVPRLPHLHGADGSRRPEGFEAIEPYIGGAWRDTPWLHGECYLYHWLYDACGFFSGPNEGMDMFLKEKDRSAEAAQKAMAAAAERVAEWRREGASGGAAAAPAAERVRELLKAALWGNRVDLALFSSADQSRLVACDDSKLLSDQGAAVAARLAALPRGRDGARRVDIVADNYGFEIFSDLVLVVFLLQERLVDRADLHLKKWPYFVSDATVADVRRLIGWLRGAEQPAVLRELGADCASLVADGRLRLLDDEFWNSPSDFRGLPQRLREHVAGSGITLLKGDLNYRKLVGDRHWARDSPFAEAAAYWPGPCAALRTCKSEVVVGVPKERQSAAEAADPWPRWAVCGDYALLQCRD
eukprot:TRINITY_DN47887_c0_g1_i1.p1 TRINITY_DN47887_c0_g1~~TRINITY_DN47887_c0_g1_i1.p1  ORF type:complete len:446 (+),score=145.08 TRINITY_DN47887_c0_g1_i1:70-1338(+)